MTFARYMALCLYHPEHGYYMQGRERTGVRGDYFTSADLHPIFARLIARQAAEMWEVLDKPARFTWAEMGAGRGLFARDFVAWVAAARPDFMAALDYVAVEPGPRQRDRLLERLGGEAVATVDGGQRALKVRVLGGLEELEPVTGCFFSNELVDAFPVSVVTRSGGRLNEIYVTAEGDTLREEPGPISDSRVAAAVARNQLEEGQRAEVSLEAVQWIRAVAEELARGFVVTIDYGDLAERLYTVDRSRGTLMAYREHVASENFFDAPGEQDLTAHVNFSALIDAGREAGLDLAGLTTQERFLMALGETTEFRDLYDDGQTEAERLRARLKLKRLLDPGSMGNIFKVLVQHKGVSAPQLTGLKYYRR